MDPTAEWISERYQELGEPQPYNPLWAIRAMTRLDAYNAGRVAADTPCDQWGAALKAYNAGLGFVLRAQKRSGTPGKWFGSTEKINAGQSAKNFEYSRLYPRGAFFNTPLLKGPRRVGREGAGGGGENQSFTKALREIKAFKRKARALNSGGRREGAFREASRGCRNTRFACSGPPHPPREKCPRSATPPPRHHPRPKARQRGKGAGGCGNPGWF